MKRLFHLLTLMLLATSCGPVGYTLMLENRQPSPSGLDVSGKTMAIVYLESESGVDSVFNNKVSDALAVGLEDEYFDGDQAIGIYKVTKKPDGDYSSKDTLANYVMSLNSDVIMLLDTPVTTDSTTTGIKTQRSSLYVYDSRGEDEVVNLHCDLKTPRIITASSAITVGNSLSTPLKSEWKTESYTLIYYDGFDTRWIDAIEYAQDMNWADAISIWLGYVKSRDVNMSSSAMYNIAMGCYMLKEYELADEWLKRSDDTHVLSLSGGMHKRINIARANLSE